MTIVERCRELRKAIKAFDEVRRAEAEARGLRELYASVFEQCNELQETVARLHVLEQEGLPISKRVQTERVRELLEKTRNGVTSTQSRPAEAAQFLRALRKVSDDAKGTLESALGGYLRESHTAVASTLKQFEQMPEYASQFRVLRELLQITPEHASSLSATDLRAFLQRYAQERSKLPLEEVPLEVRTFLKDAYKGGARLELLTDLVQKWLASKGLLKSVRVIITPTRVD